STTVADTTDAVVDNVAPTVTDAHIAISGATGTGGIYRIGDTVTAMWTDTVAGDANADTVVGVTFDFSQFGGGMAFAATNGNGVWTATYTIVAGSIDAMGRNVTATVTDNAGNATTTADTGNATVDNVAPKLSISSDVASLKAGETATITFTFSEDPGAGFTLGNVLVEGGTLSAISGTGLTRTAIFTPNTGMASGVAGITVSVGGYSDFAGNAGASAALPTLSMDTLAPAAPVLTSTSPTNATAPLLRGTAEAGSTVDVTVGGATFRVTAGSDGQWTLDTADARLITQGHFKLGADGVKDVLLRSTDAAGNSSEDSSKFTLDTTAPTAPTALPLIGGGATDEDWRINGSWAALAGSADADATVTVDWGDGGPMAVALREGSDWSVDRRDLAEGTYTVTVTATDAAGNSTRTVHTLVVDWTSPTVTAGAIRLSGATGTNGTFRIGDTVVATWDNSATGDHNTEVVSAVLMDFSAFGGDRFAQATLVDGRWTASYTIVSGLNEQSDAQVQVTAWDLAGNAGWASRAAAVDNFPPVLSDTHVSLDGATGTGGAFKIGDVVTVSWTQGGRVPGLALGADGSAYVVVDFAAFGGAQVAATYADGVWTARYTIVDGRIESEGCSVAIAVTDTGGNVTKGEFAFEPAVDNVRPVPVTPSLTVAENAAGGHLIGDLSVPGAVRYELVDYLEGNFEIDPQTGMLSVSIAPALDHELAAEHFLTVRLTDAAGNTADALIRIAVSDVNEVPVPVDDTAEAAEAGGVANAAPGVDPRGNVLANDTDPDAGDTLQVVSVRASDGAKSLQVKVGSSADAGGVVVQGRYGSLIIGADGSYVYRVDNANADVQALRAGSEPLTDEFLYQMADSGGMSPAGEVALTVSISGANDEPLRSQLIGEQFATQGADFSFTVAEDTFADVDEGDSLTWSAELIDGSALPSWLSFDAESHTFFGTPANGDVGELQVRVTVSDTAGANVYGDFTLAVANANDDPTGGVYIGGTAV
ncbi:putative Ig domain-containing protein, partial [Azohydromonas lata]|uniref:putative Ig domain-containing protein n=1 Tax=Azohydromonas lata TaxID=45677 RepID=UPI00157BCF9C